MSPPNPPNRHIYLYRMVQGHKVRWKFEVDHHMVIINEGPDDRQAPEVQKSEVTPGHKPVSVPTDALTRYTSVLDERGIKYSITPQGQVIVNDIPANEKLIMQFFDLNAPEPSIPDVTAIRERYKQEYEQAGGAACPACQLNSLQRKYRQILKAKLNNG